MKALLEFLSRVIQVIFPRPTQPAPHVEIVTPPKPKLNLEIPVAGSREWKGIVIHHSASPDGPARDWDGIVKYHTSYRIEFNTVTKEEFERRLAAHDGKVFQKPWLDVGYHAGTELVNGEPVFRWGRPLSMVGAHAGVEGVSNKFNEEFLGICCIGNYDTISPEPALWDFNIRVTKVLMEAFEIPADQVIGHREVFDRLGVPRQKTCPGKCWNMDLFRQMLRVA